MRSLKGFYGYRDIGQKRIGDTFVKIQSTFMNMLIQSFLKCGEFWGYLHISF